MATGAKTIAFLVGPKNERLVVNFISSHLNDLSGFRLLLTDTETKALEPLLTLGLDVHYLPSLEKKGDVELAHRAAKNQIAAVFVFNPSSISRHMNTERFFALVEKCWASNTPLAMNQSLIDLCLNDLIAIEGASRPLSHCQPSVPLSLNPCAPLTLVDPCFLSIVGIFL